MHEIVRSARLALRALSRAPVFALTVVLTLAITIGANATVYSIIDRVLLRPLPFPESDRLAYISHDSAATSLAISIPPGRLLDWSERTSTFGAISAYYTERATDTTSDRPESLSKATIGPDFLDVWGIRPALGRGFAEEEHRLGGPASALVSDRYWRERMNASPDAIGATLTIEGQPVTLVGVMPAELAFVNADVDLWSPLLIDAPWVDQRATGWFGGVIGRLRANVTLDQAVGDLRSVQSALADEFPETDAELTVNAVPYRDTVIAPFRGSLWLLFGAVSVLLLIACANIAALLLARVAQRRRDTVIRHSLGASRFRVALHLLNETVVLVVAGAAGGILLAQAAVAVLESYTNDLPTFGGIELDGRVLAYTVACAAAVVLLCGLLPAVRGAGDAKPLPQSGRTQVSYRQPLSWTLVGVQVALSVTLLAGAGLLLRSFDALSRIDPGFDSDGILTFLIHADFNETNDLAAVLQRMNRTIAELDALPGVESAGTSLIMPGTTWSNQVAYEFADGAPPVDTPLIAESRMVSPSYFNALRIPQLGGELCRQPDEPGAPQQAMVNRAFAERYFGTSPVIGRELAGQIPTRIVGVVGNAREVSIHVEPPPTVYVCYAAPNPLPWFFVRTSGDPDDFAETVRGRLAEIEPLRPIYEIAPLSRLISDVYAQDRLRTILLTLFSVTALSLACLGIYGTLSYIVSLRRREVGLRVALGAIRRRIVFHYLTRVMKVVGIACVAGFVSSLAIARLLSGLLYGVSPTDPLTLASVVGIVVLVATAAGLVPSWRASRIDPATALRDE